MKLVDSNFEDCKIILNTEEDRIENCRFLNAETGDKKTSEAKP